VSEFYNFDVDDEDSPLEYQYFKPPDGGSPGGSPGGRRGSKSKGKGKGKGGRKHRVSRKKQKQMEEIPAWCREVLSKKELGRHFSHALGTHAVHVANGAPPP